MRPWFFFGLSLALAGCGPSTQARQGAPDGGDTEDLAPVAGDLAAPRDLSGGVPRYRYVIDKVYMPTMRTAAAFDLNGDGSADNQLGALAATLAARSPALGTAVQSAETQAIALDGDALELISLGTSDPQLAGDPRAEVGLYVAVSHDLPDLTGLGQFTIAPNTLRPSLPGGLSGGTFASVDPARAASPPSASLCIALLAKTRVTLTLHGARITFAAAKNGLMTGQLNGALTLDDLQKVLIPVLALNLTALENQPNCDAACAAVKANFDINPADKTVTAFEVATYLDVPLKPDVEVFDAKGNWAPSLANRNPNGWSLGLTFTAKPATFTE